MIKIEARNNVSIIDTVIFNETSTIADVMAAFGQTIAGCEAFLDGGRIMPSQADATLADFDLDPDVKHVISITHKTQNAVQAYLTGSSVVLVSSYTPDDIRCIKKYRPEALVEKDEKGVPQFVVDIVDEGMGSVSKFGASFSSHVNGSGNATITVTVPDGTVNAREWAGDTIGRTLFKLNAMEEKYDQILAEIEDERQTTYNLITVL